jgi:antitoxin StbD
MHALSPGTKKTRISDLLERRIRRLRPPRKSKTDMEQVLATRSVSITELKRSPSAVIQQAGSEAVAVLNHNRPAAYLLPADVYEDMLERLNADLRSAIQDGISGGPAIPADAMLAELAGRHAEPGSPVVNSGDKQSF